MQISGVKAMAPAAPRRETETDLKEYWGHSWDWLAKLLQLMVVHSKDTTIGSNIDKLFHTWLDYTILKFQTCNLSEFEKRTHHDPFVVELDIGSMKCVIFVGVFQTILL